MKEKIILLLLSTAVQFAALAGLRTETLLEKGWKFTRSDDKSFSESGFDDSNWQTVTVPHDWAIYGPFSSQNDRQHVVIEQDGQKQAMPHDGRTGGLLFTGVGWYGTTFNVPQPSDNKRITLLFDGAMSDAHVWVNGKEAGHWAYGYNSFFLDVTELVRSHGNNTLAVRLENLPESARWYPGAGLYRNVHLIVTEDINIPVWGTQIITPVVRKDNARVVIKAKIEKSVCFDHDCREGICGMCSLFVNGHTHGNDSGITTCQLHMRRFKDGDIIWRAAAFGGFPCGEGFAGRS